MNGLLENNVENGDYNMNIQKQSSPKFKEINMSLIDKAQSYDSGDSRRHFDNGAPTPMEMSARSLAEQECSQEMNDKSDLNISNQSLSDNNNNNNNKPIGGILTKYKQSGLLLKPRKSYTAQNNPNSLNIDNIIDKDVEEENVNINEYELNQSPKDNEMQRRPNLSVQLEITNNNRLSPKLSPKMARMSRAESASISPEFRYKSRNKKNISMGGDEDMFNEEEELKNNSKIRTISNSSVQFDHNDNNDNNNNTKKKRYIDSFSSVSGVSELGLTNNNSLRSQHHERFTSQPIDENKEIGPEEPNPFEAKLFVEPIQIMPPSDNLNGDRKKKVIVDDKYVSYWEYIAILISSGTTWIFYNIYVGFYNWNKEITEFNHGNPTKQWYDKYLLLVIVYCIFIWINMGFNPFYFSFFRKLSKSSRYLMREDINTRSGTMRICLLRFWIISAIIYCIIMTGLCIARYHDFSVRLAQLTVLYVLMPPLITNIIISGYLLKRQPGIFIIFHTMSWLISTFIVMFLFKGHEAKNLHLGYYFIVSVGSFCVYLIAAVCIKASILIHEADLRKNLSPKNIALSAYNNNNNNSDNNKKSGDSPSILSVDSSSPAVSVGYIREKYKGKPIDCCCNKCELSLSLFFKIESLISAFTFWGFWGIVSISEKPKYDVITELLFVIACCWWNPMYYSTTNRASKSIKKCILNSYFIFGAIIGIIQCIIFGLYWYIKVTYGKRIGINGDNGLYINGIDIVLHEQNVRYTSFLLSFVVSFIFYFPATGYLFYRSPLPFGLSHLFFATMAVFIPLAITDIADRNLLKIDNTEFGIKFITDEFDRDIQNKKVTVIIFYMVVFAMFLSLSGFSCTYFRFKKVLVESQSIVTGYKSLQYRLEYPMTLTMFITLMMAFGDLITDFLFAFIELGLKPWIKVTSITLFIVQILLQIFSLQSVISKVRNQLDSKNGKHQLRYFREWLYGYVGKCGIIIIYPFCWLSYYLFLFSISLMLGLSKTIAVRQVQQWWLSLIVVNYKKTANKKLKQHTKHQKEIKQRLENIGQREIGQYNKDKNDNIIPRMESEYASVDDYFYLNNINDNRYNLNDIHAAYWAELDKIYVNNDDDNDDNDNDNISSSEEEESDLSDISSHDEDDNDNDNNNNNNNNNHDNKDNDFGNVSGVEEEYDPNYDPRFDDDNISIRIQKINRKRQNTLKNQKRAKQMENKNKNKKKKKKRGKKKKRKRKRQIDKVWLGWNTEENDLGIIFKIYLFIDKYTPKWMRHLYINANVYNTYFLTELIVESLPQCILIITNAYLKNDWTPISIASIFFSGVMIIYNVLKIVYYVGYIGKDMRSVVL